MRRREFAYLGLRAAIVLLLGAYGMQGVAAPAAPAQEAGRPAERAPPPSPAPSADRGAAPKPSAAAHFCAGLDLFTTRRCPGKDLAAAFRKADGKAKKFLDSAGEGSTEGLLFARDEQVYLLLRAAPTRPLAEIALPEASYTEGSPVDAVLPGLSRILPIDRPRGRFLLMLKMQPYEGFGELLFLVGDKPAAASLIMQTDNIELRLAGRGATRFSIAAQWTQEGFTKKAVLGKQVRVGDAACTPLLARLADDAALRAVTAADRQIVEDSIAFTVDIRQTPVLSRCRASSRAIAF